MKQNTYQRPRSLAEAEVLELANRPAAPVIQRVAAPKAEPRVEAKPTAPACAPKRQPKPRSVYSHHSQDPAFQLRRRLKFEQLAMRKAFIQQIVAALTEEDLARLAQGANQTVSNIRIFARTGQAKLSNLVPLETWLLDNGHLSVAEKFEKPRPVARRRRLPHYESVALTLLLCGGRAA